MRIKFNKKEGLVLALMSIVHFCLIVDFMILMPLGPQLMRLLAITAQQFSHLVAVYTLSAGISSLAAAIYMDRFDRKHVLMVTLFGFAAGNLTCAIAPDYFWLLAARSLTGVFVGLIGPVMFAIVSDVIEIEKRGTALGIVMSAFAFASILGIPFGLYLANTFSWQAPFVFLLGSSSLVLLLIFVFLPAVREHLQKLQNSQQKITQLKELIFDPQKIKALIFMFCLLLGHFSLIPFLFPSFIANGGVSESKLPVVYLVSGLASILGSIFAGNLADKNGKKRIFSFSLLVSLPIIYIVTNLGLSSVVLLTLVAASFFAVMSGRMTPALTLVSATVTLDKRASFMSLMNSVQNLSVALSAYIAGLIVIRSPEGKILNYPIVGVFAITFSVLALVMIRHVKPVEGQNI